MRQEEREAGHGAASSGNRAAALPSTPPAGRPAEAPTCARTRHAGSWASAETGWSAPLRVTIPPDQRSALLAYAGEQGHDWVGEED